jgi:hypothetical protein
MGHIIAIIIWGTLGFVINGFMGMLIALILYYFIVPIVVATLELLEEARKK